jgi:hypothetical protein
MTVVLTILASLFDPFSALVCLLTCAWQAGPQRFDLALVTGGETQGEVFTSLKAWWRGYLAVRLKRATTSPDLYIVISAMSAEHGFHHVLTPAEFSWFAHTVERMRDELRSHQANPGAAIDRKLPWGPTRELCGFDTHTHDSYYLLMLRLKQDRSSQVFVELRSHTATPAACRMGEGEFEEFAGSVALIRGKFAASEISL